MALRGWATLLLQWRLQWASNGRPGANPQKTTQFGLHSATRVHEVGIASNRGSACRGEYVPGPCTHRPSPPGSWLYPKAVRYPALEAADQGRVSDGGEVVARTQMGNLRPAVGGAQWADRGMRDRARTVVSAA